MRFLFGRSYSRPTTQASTLRVDLLEARDVPSATTANLTTAAATQWIGGSEFMQAQARPTGTGVIDSFVRVQALGNKSVEAGYNTDARPLAYNENSSPQFTRSLTMDKVPVWTAPDGTRYREFLLDINQKASAPLISLDQLKVFVSTTNGAISGQLVNGGLQGANLAYDMDAGGDMSVALNARLSTGSGSGDMVLRIPESAFVSALAGQPAGTQYVYLYSQFSGANGGFEEWAVEGDGGGAVTVDGASVSGHIYFITGEGVMNPASGVTVTLLLPNGDVDEVTPDADGLYVFHNVLLEEGQYEIQVQGNYLDFYFSPGDANVTDQDFYLTN